MAAGVDRELGDESRHGTRRLDDLGPMTSLSSSASIGRAMETLIDAMGLLTALKTGAAMR
ncbi:hypothetical protein ACIBIZ_08790 [Nonomuraea spiralis]|uniref:hypothetical protein n=1 Tax=Nonomuraea spiralis TaxID=46182 RepID=UPI0037BC636C